MKKRNGLKKFISFALIIAMLTSSLFMMSVNSLSSTSTDSNIDVLSENQQFILFEEAMNDYRTNENLTTEIIKENNYTIQRTYLLHGFYVDEIVRDIHDITDIIDDGNWYNARELYKNISMNDATTRIMGEWKEITRQHIINVYNNYNTVIAGLTLYATFLYNGQEVNTANPPNPVISSAIAGVSVTNTNASVGGTTNSKRWVSASPIVTSPYPFPYDRQTFSMLVSCDINGNP